MIDSIVKVNKEISKELDMSENIVAAVNKFYWGAIKEAIRDGSHTNIRIRGIGTIATSMLKLKKDILRIINRIRRLRSSTQEYTTITKEEVIDNLYVILRKLLARRNELASVYRPRQIKRNEKIKLSETNME